MASAARRRWCQFRLRTLLLGVALVALVAVAYRTYVEPYAQQRRAMEVIRELGGAYQSSGPTPWQRPLFGADHQNLRSVSLADCDDPDRYVPYIARLPSIETLVVGGEQFTDGHLRRLSRLSTLRTLILDSTDVSEEALVAWQQRLPQRCRQALGPRNRLPTPLPGASGRLAPRDRFHLAERDGYSPALAPLPEARLR